MDILHNTFLQVIEENIKEISQLDENKQQALFNNLSSDIIQPTATIILDRLKIDASKMIKYRTKYLSEFQKKNIQKWKEGFTKFEMMLVILYEAGEDFHSEFSAIAQKENNLVFEVLTRLYARCIQIGNEILVLLKNGFPDGAHARWRTIHEISTIANFIIKHGNDIAKRYLDHSIVESYHGSQEFQKYHKKLRQPSLTSEELKGLKEDYNILLNTYGQNFANGYGWAVKAIRKSNPSFENIELDIGFDIYRPLYRMACHNIHAAAKGILFKIGYNEEKDKIILTGPSNEGFTEPAHGTAISLYLIAKGFFNLYPNMDRAIITEILYQLSEEIGEAFIKIQLNDTNAN